jgi:hypothetical protein
MKNLITKQAGRANLNRPLLLLLAAGAFLSAGLYAEIPITEELSLSGYIDMAYTDLDDGTGSQTDVAEYEFGLSFTPAESDWSAAAEISFNGTDASFETATITYASSDELSFTFGNILSYQGFETYDATGLFQYSYSGPSVLYSAGYAVGASMDYVTDDFAVGIWAGDTTSDVSLESFWLTPVSRVSLRRRFMQMTPGMKPSISGRVMK